MFSLNFQAVHCGADAVYLYGRGDTRRFPYLVLGIVKPIPEDDFKFPFLFASYKEGTLPQQFASSNLTLDTKVGDRFEHKFTDVSVVWEIVGWKSPSDFFVTIMVFSEVKLSRTPPEKLVDPE